MNKLLEPPPGIVETVVRYECPRCGNNCQCGVPYIAKTVRAAEAIRANPEKSDRAIAKEIDASPTTVGKAREQLSTDGQLETSAAPVWTARRGRRRHARRITHLKSRRPIPPLRPLSCSTSWSQCCGG